MIPLVVALAAEELIPTLPTPGARDMGLFLESHAGQTFLFVNWSWLVLLNTWNMGCCNHPDEIGRTLATADSGPMETVAVGWHARGMAEFTGEDLTNSRFDHVELIGARFEHVDLTGAQFRNVDLTGATIHNADLVNVVINGDVENLRINDVDVVPLIEAELDRRYPERAKLRPSDADGFREAWAVIEGLWPPTVERARRLAPELHHERVDGEWSFIETLRHLVFATDAWVKRAMLGDPSPYDALDLPHTEMGDIPGVPNDPDARPTLDEVLALRADRMTVVRKVLGGLTDDALAGMTDPTPKTGYPPANAYPVLRCLQCVVNEEWAHRLYAERDLAVLEARA